MTSLWFNPYVYSVATIVYPLETLSASAKTSMRGAYSLRRLLPTYTGAVVNVRRSNDNTTSDFFADQNGNLTTGANGSGSSYATWVGGETGFVVIWYDQSGSGNNATTTTQAEQPSIDNTNKMILFTTNTGFSRLKLPDSTVPTGTSSYSVSLRHGTAVGAGGIIPAFLGSGTAGTAGGVNAFVHENNAYKNYWWGNDAQQTGSSYAVGNRVSFLYSTGTTRQIFVNGTSVPISGGNNTRNGTAINNFIAYGDAVNNNYLNGQLYYLTIFNTSLASADRLIIEAM